MSDLLSGALAVLGAGLIALAGIGVIRFPDLYSRMHAATKAATLGFALVAAGGIVAVDEGRPKLVLAIVVIFITAPVASHLIGRAAYRAERVELRLEGPDQLGADLDDPSRPPATERSDRPR